jgi:hypothetical protein
MKDILATLLVVIIEIGFIALIVGLPIVYVIGNYRRANRMLSQWAASNGYRIIESERRRFFKGPFFWSSSNNQIIYHVTIQDAYGNIHRGWVRCGTYFWGAWTDELDVRWDE